MPANPVGPPARPPGESAVPGKPTRTTEGKPADGLGENLRTLGSDLAGWLGLSKVQSMAERIQATFEKTAKVVEQINLRQGQPKPAGDKPSDALAKPKQPGSLMEALEAMRGKAFTGDEKLDTHLQHDEFMRDSWSLAKKLPGGMGANIPGQFSVPASKIPSSVIGPQAGAGVTGPAAGAGAGAGAVAGPAAAGAGASKVVGPAIAGAEGGAAGAIASIAAAAGPAAIAIGGFTIALAAGAFVVKKAFDALSAEVGKLQEYSAPVAAAQGRNEVRSEMSLIRRGEEIGPQLGKFADDMGKLQEAQAEVWTQMLKVLLQIYEACRPIVEVLTKLLQMVASGIEITKAGFDYMAALTTLTNEDNLKAASEMLAGMTKMGAILYQMSDEFGDDGSGMDPMLAKLMDSWGFPGKPPGRPPGRRAAPPRGPAGLPGGAMGF